MTVTASGPSRTLVVGSSGFVGGAIARAALIHGGEVAGIARSRGGPVPCLTTSFDRSALTQAFDSFKPDVLVSATGMPSVAATESDPQGGYASTVEPFRNVVAAIEAANLSCSVVYISSAAVYGDPVQLPVGEDAPVAPISIYGQQRIQCEVLAAGLSQRCGLPVYAVRPFSLFGASQKRLLVWELFNRIRNDDVVTIAGTGHEMRDFLSIESFANCVLQLAKVRPRGFAAVNVASGIGTTVRGLAELMLDVMGVDKPIVCEGRTFPNDPLRWQADISRYCALTGSDPGHDLRRSIATLVEAWR